MTNRISIASGGFLLAIFSGNLHGTAFASTEMPHSSKSSIDSKCVVVHQGKTLLFGDDKCFRRFPKKKLHGVWIVCLEKSIFIENASDFVNKEPARNQQTWLNVDTENLFRRLKMKYDGTCHQFSITFLGRKSSLPGFYGHMGQFSHGILVEDMISLRPLMAKH